MKITEPNFYVSTPYGDNLGLGDGIKMLRFIERQARISHRSENRVTPNSWERFITDVVMGHGDWSVTEHAYVTVTFRVDRGVTHELVRHRLFAFTQESTRFVRYKDGIEVIYPAEAPPVDLELWSEMVKTAESHYEELLKRGWRPQEARSVLPMATAATIAASCNLRNWRHFFLMRTSKNTHADFRRVAIPLLAEFKRCIPLLYDDIEPNQTQSSNLKKAR